MVLVYYWSFLNFQKHPPSSRNDPLQGADPLRPTLFPHARRAEYTRSAFPDRAHTEYQSDAFLLPAPLFAAAVFCAALPARPGKSADWSRDYLRVRISIAHELSDRGFGKTAILKSGTYIGGEDIPVGKYILETCDDGKNTGELALMGTDPEDGETICKLYNYVTEEVSYYISIEEGDYLKATPHKPRQKTAKPFAFVI